MQRIEKVGKIIYGISRGVGDGVIEVSEEFKKLLTSPKQYAREIKDSLVTLVDNYDAQKTAIYNACTGDFSKVNELLTDAPESLKKYYTEHLPQHYRVEYLEMQPTKQDIEAWVVETILWDKKVDATWQALKEMPAEDIAYHISKTATEIIVTDKVISVAGKVVGATCSTALNKGGQMLEKAPAVVTKVSEYIEQAVINERKVEIAGTGLKVPERIFKTTEEVAAYSPKMEIVKDVGKGSYLNKEIRWTQHGYKHFPPKNASWKEIIKSTKNAPAKYKPNINIEQLEKLAWKESKCCTNGKPWKVMKFDYPIGAKNGIETNYVRIELSANTIHGHPITPSEYKKLIK